jgi:N-acetylglucosamine-6-phosphate deacetylase
MVTLAPELPGAPALTAELASRGVIVAAGHSDADLSAARNGIDAGVRYATHLWNAMPPLHHRRPGLVGALLDDARVTIGLIADGGHVAPEMLRLAWRAAPGRISLVSDAMAGLDMPAGRHRLGGREVEIGPDGARLNDGTLAGCVTALDAGLRRLADATAAPLPELLATVSSVPAGLLGLDDGRGELRIGGRADITLLTADLDVAATIVNGRVAHAADELRWGR